MCKKYFIRVFSSITEGGLPYLKELFQHSVSCFVFFSGWDSSVRNIYTPCTDFGGWISLQGCLLSSCFRGLYAGETCMARHPAKHNRLPCLKDVYHLLQNPDNVWMGGSVAMETAKYFVNQGRACDTAQVYAKYTDGPCVNCVNAVKTKKAIKGNLIIQKQRVVYSGQVWIVRPNTYKWQTRTEFVLLTYLRSRKSQFDTSCTKMELQRGFGSMCSKIMSRFRRRRWRRKDKGRVIIRS